MKPRPEPIVHDERRGSLIESETRRFPLIDFSYHIGSFGRFGGGYANSSTSFLNISRDYFRSEARWSYLAEVLFFALIIATVAVPLIYGARVIIHFFGLPTAA
jgi:cytochrome c biogenesis protein CcdA